MAFETHVKQKFWSNHQENLENNALVKFDQKKFELNNFSLKTKGSIYSGAFLEKRKWSHRIENVFGKFNLKLSKLHFFRSYDFIFNFFEIFSKMCQTISTLPVILSFIKFVVAQTSITLFFQLLKS